MIAYSSVFTLDADFRIYRRHRNQIIPVIMPGDDQTPGSRLAEAARPLPRQTQAGQGIVNRW